MKYKGILAVVIFAIHTTLWAQFNYAGTIEEIKVFYENFNKQLMNVADDKQAIHLKYTTEISSDIPGWGEKKQSTQIEAFVQGEKVLVFSDMFEMLKDDKDIYFISHTNKTIQHHTAEQAREIKNKTELLQRLLDFQTYALENSELESGKFRIIDGKSIVEIKLKGNQELLEKHKVSGTTFWFNNKTKQIWKVAIDFENSREIEQMFTTYEIIDFDAGKVIPGGSVKKMVFKKGDELQSKYGNYTVE